MLLTVNHISRYQYDKAVPYALQRLRLWPANGTNQTVHEWQVQIDDVAVETSYVDGFGNRTALVRHDPVAEAITVHAAGKVETEDRNGVLGLGSGIPPSWVFERETELTRPGEQIRDLASAAAASEAERLPLLHRLMDEIHRRVAYQPGTTSVATDAEAALVAATGVCQDHSHILISAARLCGIPARYVSGYLMMEGVVMQTASHAWAEAFVEGLGWVGFDAANNICPDERYVRIAAGLDYRFAAPVAGIRTGNATETLAVEISVEQ